MSYRYIFLKNYSTLIKGMLLNMVARDDNMWDLFDKGNKLAAIDDNGDTLLYSDLAELSVTLKNVAHRKLCFNLCKNTLGSLAGYVSMIEAGVVPVMLAADMDAGLLHNLIQTYEPDFFWCDKEGLKSVSDYILPEHTDEIDVRTAEEINKGLVNIKSFGLYASVYKNASLIFDNLALLLTTSGSTGSPKFVRQSYKNIKANTNSIIEYLEIDENERPITTLPMNYTYGLSIINTHIMAGATILITDKTLMDRGFWNFFKAEQATSFGGVPYTYEILDKLRLTRMDLPSLKTMTQAGGKLSIKLHEKLAQYAADTGRKFVVMYGQTEATARMGYLPADKALDKIGSMGIAIPGGEFILIDSSGETASQRTEPDSAAVADNKNSVISEDKESGLSDNMGQVIKEPHVTGELVYKGENVTLGYAVSREDLSKEDERNGVLETGDMAQFDEDGYFYIVGRKKRFLKIFGKRVNLDEVDRLIKGEYPEFDSATTGKDDNMVVYITDKESVDEVRKYVATKTQTNLSAVIVKYIEAIPRSDSGKVLYSELTEN